MRYLLLPVLLLASQWAFAQAPLFDSIAAYPVKTKVNSFQVKDITGDGVPDLTLIYSAIDDWFGILPGKGNGSLGQEQLRPKPATYYRNDIADLNKDGYPDLVISSYWENGIRIFYGNKAGEFLNSTYLFTGVHGREVRCVDINNDGHIDIVTTTSGSGHTISLHVFINKGDGSFFPQKIYPSLLDTCKEIFITDKNNDGLPDVVVSSSFPWLLFYYQQPDGSFKAQYRPTNTTARVSFSDVNQDNREDLVLLYSSFDNMPGTDSMLILLNAGDTSFSAPFKVPQFNSHKIRPTQMRIADINRDGYQDLVVNQLDWLGEYDDTIFYMTGRANAGFNDPVAIKAPANVLYSQLADLNKDGFADLIVSCDNNTIYTYFNSQGKVQDVVNELVVYPNPASHRLFLKGLPEGRHTISLYNANGGLLGAFVTASRWWTYPIDALPAGVYYLSIQGPHKKTSLPFRKI